ncbi:hypothetical protein [Nonomuraea lactucae]|uniref:hypothetical protein n=1 Tax=Nonomuraea lactucae TaxID=2249762 RepID=UPI000DE3C079|nr:hypothetical protein [Nonomuraea lactucae]
MPLSSGIRNGNVTLVAMYGEKPDAVKDLIVTIQEILAGGLGQSFEPHPLDQIHCTIIGLEGVLPNDSGQVLNRNYLELRHEQRHMDLAAAAQMLNDLQLQVRIGGYRLDRDYGFTSRGSHPYNRSFSFQQGRAVVVGWAEGDKLNEARRAFQAANILHKYHADPLSRDNDLYLVIGRAARTSAADRVLLTVREYLAGHALRLAIGQENLSVVTYKDSALLSSGCAVIPIPVPEDRLRNLYQE